MERKAGAGVRERLNREKVLRSAVALADEAGIGQLSMRRLAQELQVVPMALYKHVAGKEELLDGMVDIIIADIDPAAAQEAWKEAVRLRILSARRVLQRHQWARQVLETRTTKTPGVLAYIDSFIGIFLSRGFSADLTHHVMHAIGSRMWGFTQELFEEQAQSAPANDPDQHDGVTRGPDGEAQQAMLHAMSERYPNVFQVAMASAHNGTGVVGQGCDDQFEFEFALDILLDGIERLHGQGWTSAGSSGS